MTNIISIKDVRGYIDENGIAYLNLEDCARGLGFTEVAKSGNTTIRWRTVGKSLCDINFIATSCDGYSTEQSLPKYIPENVFYKLCFKAKNEAARAFQDRVTDEVLPAIRKHGVYMTPERVEEFLRNPNTIICLIKDLSKEREKRQKLETLTVKNRPKVAFANAVKVSQNSISVGALAKLMRQNGYRIGQNRLYAYLRKHGYLIRKNTHDRNVPTQKALELGLIELKESVYIDARGKRYLSKTSRITGKGQLFFVNHYLNSLKRNSEVENG